jgi:uncharacterized membrane protein
MNGQKPATSPEQDSNIERTIGRVLLIGVTASSACLAVGLLLELLGVSPAARLLLNVGLVALLATPVARVVASVAEYALSREWTFVVLTLIVLLELFGSLVAAVR